MRALFDLQSGIETVERVEIIQDLRLGTFDMLIRINLLREGLDIAVKRKEDERFRKPIIKNTILPRRAFKKPLLKLLRSRMFVKRSFVSQTQAVAEEKAEYLAMVSTETIVKTFSEIRRKNVSPCEKFRI